MSELAADANDPGAEPAAEPLEPPDAAETWTLVALIPGDGLEPRASLPEADATAAWCAASALWHPAILAVASALPRLENTETPSYPAAREIRVVAGPTDRLPPDSASLAEDMGAVLLEAGADRSALVARVLERIAPDRPAAPEPDGPLARIANDFLALGAARWWLRDLTIAMGHADFLDVESLTREVLTGASAWAAGDHPTAANRLRAAFELLTQARERFYPVDAYLIDIALLDPSSPAGALADALEARAPFTVMGPSQAIENQAQRDPERLAALREAIGEGWADVVGGSYAEADEPLLPLESILWQFRRGAEVYRDHLDHRNTETVARRRFALYPQLPQVAKRFGFRFAVHLGFDAGRFPLRSEAKRLWESPDGTSLETLLRPPLAADRALSGWQLPWRLALTMKDDHVATMPLVHWPNLVASWYTDLRRVAAYSPVLVRWVTLNDFFHLTDRPFESFRPDPDDYVTPYLAQAVARRDRAPISARAAHARLRARFEALSVIRGLALALGAAGPESAADPAALEQALETNRLDEARTALDEAEPPWAEALARAIGGSPADPRPGYLVLNPAGTSRQVPVLLPGAAADLRPEKPLRSAQFTDEGVWAVVELPAFGYAWVPRDANPHAPLATGGSVSVKGRVFRNESLEFEVDESTGGLRAVRGVGEEVPRIGQQLVIHGLTRPEGAAAPSRMRAESFEVDYGGPALLQAVARGVVIDTATDRRLASFRQRYRLWSGRPILEIDIRLDDLDPAWLEQIAQADPWSQYLACRWAWPDANSMLRRTCLLAPELTEAERPETPDAVDVSTRRHRTAVLFGGLAHQRRHSPRMLDTLLIAGRESAREFRLGVVLDLENPAPAAVDLITPAYVVPTDAGPPRTGSAGWLFLLDNKSVVVTHVAYVPATEDRGWGLAFHLLETGGHASRCRLRCFRNPNWARQTDLQNELIVDLPIEGDAVLIDLTPHELARVEVTIGTA